MANRYAITSFLPGFALVGLSGWDDFILRDASGKFFTVPTVPLLRERLQPLAYDIATSNLQPDPRFTDRIKWYIQPLVFGGDPSSDQNMTWVSLDQHTDAVRCGTTNTVNSNETYLLRLFSVRRRPTLEPAACARKETDNENLSTTGSILAESLLMRGNLLDTQTVLFGFYSGSRH